MEFEHVVEHGGRSLVFSSIKFPVRDASGHIYAVGGIATNITARKRAEEQLREESRINETLYRIGASLAGELDPERLMQLITDEATQLCGARFGSFFFNVGDGAGGSHQLHTISGADKERFAEMRLPWGAQAAGDPAIASHLAVPVKSRGGLVLGGLFFAHPEPGRFTAQHERIIRGIAAHAAVALESARLYKTVHEQKELLAQAVRRAEEADRRKDEFLAMLGHELRNPLAPMVTALHLMKLKGAGGERERDVIERQVRHLSRLVDDLLDVSRITRGKVELRRERFETAAAIAKAVEMVSPLLEKYVHHLEIEVPREGLMVEADPVRLAQVFQNLLTNAAKYSEPGSHIAVSAARDGGEVVVTVRDDGMGIAESLLPRIFEPFVQGDRTIDRAEGGLGLGLTLVERLVSLHGGKVSARSEGPGRGSEFEVRLPLVASAAAADAQARAPVRALPRRRVLVVDDNADAALTLAEMLRVLGSDARVALDGIQALQEADQFAPDLALVDIGLPVMDGYELCGRLREKLGARVQLIAVTGYGQDGDRERSRAAGFSRHLVKPIDLEVLQELLAGETPHP
jgi:signal transduction histidine kinase